jgi:hypothetical protein
MTNRVSYAPQDFQKKCIQAERDHESRKLALLLERVKKQIAEQENLAPSVETPKRPVTTMSFESGTSRLLGRPAPFER